MSYGTCPICGAKGIRRERRPDGNDMCENNHTYPSASAIPEKESQPLNTFVYENVSLGRVVDGDTLDLCIDLGFGVGKIERVRLFGINTPELVTPEGRDCKEKVNAMLLLKPLMAITFKNERKEDRKDKYGRYLAIIYTQQKVGEPYLNLNKTLLSGGLAKPFMDEHEILEQFFTVITPDSLKLC